MHVGWKKSATVFAALMALFFIVAGDAPPGVNEAHYLVKAKNFWNPEFCSRDIFAASGKAHTTFYYVLGWPTLFWSLETTAWIGRLIGWSIVAAGLVRLVRSLELPHPSAIVVALVWIAGLEHGNLAGEWVIGGIEAKVPAYGLVLFGLADLIEGRWNRVWIWLGSAAAMHVLTGGWSVIAAMISLAFTRWRRAFRRPTSGTLSLVVGGLISLVGVVPAWQMSAGATAEEAVAAARTYSYFRLSHHLTPSAFATWWVVRFTIMVALAVALGWRWRNDDRWRRLFAFAAGSIVITIAGLLIGLLPAVAPDLAAKLLRFYWFRLGDAVVPLVLGFVAAGWMSVPRAAAAGWAVLVLSLVLVGQSTWQRVSTGVPVSVSNRLLGLDVDADHSSQRRVMEDWIAVCQHIRASSDEDEIYLTPRHQQTFKWYAQRAEVVNWKDVPQDAASLSEWSRRFVRVYPWRLSTMRVTIRYADLRELRRDYGVRFMVVDRRVCGGELPLVLEYPLLGDVNRTYAIYRLP